MDAQATVAVLGERGPIARRDQRPRVQISWLLIGVAVTVYLLPSLQEVLVYDRTAVMAGQWWRLLTGHLVHFSVSHLFYDALVFGLTGWLIERQSRWQLAILCGLSALAISLTVFITHPEVCYYGGLSGIACATVTYLALLGITEDREQPVLWVMALALLSVKIGWECITGRALFAATAGFVVLPISHVVGAVCAVVTWAAKRRQVGDLQIEGASSR